MVCSEFRVLCVTPLSRTYDADGLLHFWAVRSCVFVLLRLSNFPREEPTQRSAARARVYAILIGPL